MGVQVDPAGQGSPLRIQVENKGGTFWAVASVSEETMSRVKESILNKNIQWGAQSSQYGYCNVPRGKRIEERESKIYLLYSDGPFFGECNVRP